jgi:hypothetical protein
VVGGACVEALFEGSGDAELDTHRIERRAGARLIALVARRLIRGDGE